MIAAVAAVVLVIGTRRGLRIDEIGDDYVLGVFRAGMEVEQVRLHRIVKPRE